MDLGDLEGIVRRLLDLIDDEGREREVSPGKDRILRRYPPPSRQRTGHPVLVVVVGLERAS